ncbi:hypothetical protein LINPERHAP1_LOCUS10737 [Linum perenne]
MRILRIVWLSPHKRNQQGQDKSNTACSNHSQVAIGECEAKAGERRPDEANKLP